MNEWVCSRVRAFLGMDKAQRKVKDVSRCMPHRVCLNNASGSAECFSLGMVGWAWLSFSGYARMRYALCCFKGCPEGTTEGYCF